MEIFSNFKKNVPLPVRIHVGPIVAYFFFKYHTRIRKNPFSPKILSIENTLDLLHEKSLSAIRFGDGEISLIGKISLSFQKSNIKLAEELKKIIQVNDPKLLICILNIWDKRIHELEKHVYTFELHHFLKYRAIWTSLLSLTQTYGDAFITRPYITLKDKDRASSIFKKLKILWHNKEVVLIEGEKARSGVGNDLFSETASLERILCPSEDAFEKYNEIKEICLKINKGKLILISLGPTAKPLAYELFLAGYRVIDIGHTDMEYEMYIRKESKITKVPYKYFNEINERNPEDCSDETYLSQIIAKIT